MSDSKAINNPNMKTVLFKFGTREQNANYTGKNGEVTIDVQTPTIIIHNGKTKGGKPMPSPTHSHSFADIYSAGTGIKITGTELSVKIGTIEGTVMAGNQQFQFNGDVSGELNTGVFTLSLREINTLDNKAYDQVFVNTKGQVTEGVRFMPSFAGAKTGQTLLWDEATNSFKMGDIKTTGGVTKLDDLSDVTLDPKLAKQVFAYDITLDTFKNLLLDSKWLTDFEDKVRLDKGKLIWDEAVKKFKVVKDAAAALTIQPIDADTLIITIDQSSQWLRFTKATAQIVVIKNDTEALLPEGTVIEGIQMGEGSVTFTPNAPVIINRLTGKTLTLAGKGAHFKLVKAGSNLWDLVGDLA